MKPLLALLGFLFPAAVSAADLVRAPIKEPAYQTRPRYCLLVFGPEARAQVWVVLDGETLYVDFNGDGDLTGPGERLKPARTRANPRPGAAIVRSFLEVLPPAALPEMALLSFRGGQRGKTWFFLEHYVPTDPTKAKDQIRVGCLIDGQFGQTGQARPAGDPRNAPVLHFDGPLTLRLAEDVVLRPGEETDLRVQVITPGRGDGTVTILDSACLPADVHPVAEIEFPGRQPIKVRVVFNERCCGDRVHGVVRVPKDASAGRAKIILSLPGWKGRCVASATCTVSILAARSAEP